MPEKKVESLAPYAIDDFQDWRAGQQQAVNDRKWELSNQLCRAVAEKVWWRIMSFVIIDGLIEDGYKIVSYPDGQCGYTRAELEAQLKQLKVAWADVVKVKIKKLTGAIQVEYTAIRRSRRRRTRK